MSRIDFERQKEIDLEKLSNDMDDLYHKIDLINEDIDSLQREYDALEELTYEEACAEEMYEQWKESQYE